jgi:hypothetical protein
VDSAAAAQALKFRASKSFHAFCFFSARKRRKKSLPNISEPTRPAAFVSALAAQTLKFPASKSFHALLL